MVTSLSDLTVCTCTIQVSDETGDTVGRAARPHQEASTGLLEPQGKGGGCKGGHL